MRPPAYLFWLLLILAIGVLTLHALSHPDSMGDGTPWRMPRMPGESQGEGR
jgi:hypothetical protein